MVAIGSALAQQGNLATAEKSFDESLTFSRETSDKSIIGYAFYGLAGGLLLRGDLAEGRKQSLESLKIRDEIGEKPSPAPRPVTNSERAEVKSADPADKNYTSTATPR